VHRRGRLAAAMTHPPGHVHIPGVHVPKFCLLCGAGMVMRVVKSGEPERHVCSSCGNIHWLEPKVAAGTLIEYGGGAGMLQRDIDPGRGKWVFPGGFVDRGETLEQAAAREAREEAHIEVGDLKLLAAFSYPGHPVVLLAYTARVISGTPTAGDEALACEIWP